MATTITPTFSLSLTGKTLITELSKSIPFSVVTKLEKSYSKNNLDAEETIDLSDITNIRFMIFESDTPFTLTINKGLVAQEIIFDIKDMFILSPMASFLTDLNSIKIKATSTTTKQIISVRVYGE